MALAGPFRPHQDRRTRGPVGKGLDQRQGRRVGRTTEKILARKTLNMIERERQLSRAMGGHRGQPLPTKFGTSTFTSKKTELLRKCHPFAPDRLRLSLF